MDSRQHVSDSSLCLGVQVQVLSLATSHTKLLIILQFCSHFFRRGVAARTFVHQIKMCQTRSVPPHARKKNCPPGTQGRVEHRAQLLFNNNSLLLRDNTQDMYNAYRILRDLRNSPPAPSHTPSPSKVDFVLPVTIPNGEFISYALNSEL